MSDSEDEAVEKQLKIVFVGDSSVGKTSIIKRYCHNEFNRQYVPTSGVDFFLKRTVLPGHREISMKICDISGDALNGNMLDKYVFNSDIIILVYDITNLNSFESLIEWLDIIIDVVNDRKPTIAIFGNKFIEKYTDNVRFCIICNYLSKIIPALQSRCTRFRFGPLNNDQIVPRLDYVIEQEKLEVTEDGKRALLTLAQGDMRKVLNILQSTWLAYKLVNEEKVYTCVGHPLKTDIENVVKWLLTEEFDETYKKIKLLKTAKGLALNDIITEIHSYVHRIEFPNEVFIMLLKKLSEIEYQLASGTNENIQLSGLIAAFQTANDLVPAEDD